MMPSYHCIFILYIHIWLLHFCHQQCRHQFCSSVWDLRRS
ncbi:hypothetical protein GDO81_002905 [Engystomops pustulosus]|uniref:Uncharacterized protein n=1 Tax=Engystomops pustulosus TaxID=76066 RepID=A0AAV7DQF8_ENGPU|nr:hypothetical protein GDO81_002905 [Engystomops pustulosus]